MVEITLKLTTGFFKQELLGIALSDFSKYVYEID